MTMRQRKIHTLSIENAGLNNFQPLMGCGAEPESLKRMLKQARGVVCSGLAANKARALASKGTEIVEDNRTLDKDGPEMLRQRLAQLAAAEMDRRGRRGRQ